MYLPQSPHTSYLQQCKELLTYQPSWKIIHSTACQPLFASYLCYESRLWPKTSTSMSHFCCPQRITFFKMSLMKFPNSYTLLSWSLRVFILSCTFLCERLQASGSKVHIWFCIPHSQIVPIWVHAQWWVNKAIYLPFYITTCTFIRWPSHWYCPLYFENQKANRVRKISL